MKESPKQDSASNTRWRPNGPFCWQPKEVLRKIRESFDSASTVSTALNVYCALSEISSNQGGKPSFHTTHAYIGSLCGLTDRTVLKRVKDLASIGVISVTTPALKAPGLYTLSRYEINSERSERNSERSESVKPSSFQSLEEKKKRSREAKPLSVADRIGLEHKRDLIGEQMAKLSDQMYYEWDRTPERVQRKAELESKLAETERSLIDG